ncbi:hypothetical protein GGI07_005259 [Coemansia sp. Benny D115]|nr:hypothetical protein GGI07_005259 [Coemansia sp. Benny D115]
MSFTGIRNLRSVAFQAHQIARRNSCRGHGGSTRRGFILPSLSAAKQYRDSKVFNYSQEQIYNVISDVDRYSEFVPMCMASTVFQHTRRTDTQQMGKQRFEAELVVGYPPFEERYTSVVRLEKPRWVEATAAPGGGVFKHMRTAWELSAVDQTKTMVRFSIDFEFASILHAQAASMVFEKIAKNTLGAYQDRCRMLYGKTGGY